MFLRKSIILNIILLIKPKKVIIRKSDVTNHNNYYLAIKNIANILKLV